jgi:hypothetical protein
MKLLNFQIGSCSTPFFGIVIKGYAVSFETLRQKFGYMHGELTDVYSYLENLPSSKDAASELLNYGEAYIVTPDEIGDPLALRVKVRIGGDMNGKGVL